MVCLKLFALLIATLTLQTVTAPENEDTEDEEDDENSVEYYDSYDYSEDSESSFRQDPESSDREDSESSNREQSKGSGRKTLRDRLPIKCNCEGPSCQCCGKLSVIGVIDENVCIDFTYVGERTELQVRISISDRVVFDRSISANDPPPICVSHPAVQILADVCFDFYGIQIMRDRINVCLRIKPRILMQPVTSLTIGCFTLTR